MMNYIMSMRLREKNRVEQRKISPEAIRRNHIGGQRRRAELTVHAVCPQCDCAVSERVTSEKMTVTCPNCKQGMENKRYCRSMESSL